MRFGAFRVDVNSGELFRDEVRVKLQDLPFRVLAVLLETPGELVTREELRARLWGAETFVDAEAGLNTAVAKLREALGDNADAPRFIETLPRRGYRFRVPPDAPMAPGGQDAAPGTASIPGRDSRSRRPWAPAIAAGVLGAIALVVAWAWWTNAAQHATVAVVLFHNETGDPQYDRLAQQLTDGTVVALAGNPRLDVIGNAAILRTPRIFSDLQQIGRVLRADFILIGQLQRGADGLVLRSHFIRVEDQKHLWARPTTGDPMTLDRQVPADVAAGVQDAFSRSRSILW
jgi:DNA-binding winged helix-turn-helix (wHTH) protein/TolB-like protein